MAKPQGNLPDYGVVFLLVITMGCFCGWLMPVLWMVKLLMVGGLMAESAGM